MIVSALIVCSLAVMLGWSVVAQRLARYHVSGPLAMVAGGMVFAAVAGDGWAAHVDTGAAERVVELVLAVLLFTDATEVHGGFLAGERVVLTRLLLIALPLTLALAFGLGLPLLPGAPYSTVFVIACVVMPLDFAPAARLLKDKNLPRWLRHVLAVESGYNDGLFSPLFALAVLLAGAGEKGQTSVAVVEYAFPAAASAVLAGAGIGALAGVLVRRLEHAGWTDHSAIPVTVLTLPFLVYAVAINLGGNGFVAAFLAAIAYKLTRSGRGQDGAGEQDLDADFAAVHAVAAASSMIMWFVFGAFGVLQFELGFPGREIGYVLLVLTLARVIPVYLALLGTRVGLRDRILLGVAGPRGTSSIVFGLLAYNQLGEKDGILALSVTAYVVLGSLLLHGVLVPLTVHRWPAQHRRVAR